MHDDHRNNMLITTGETVYFLGQQDFLLKWNITQQKFVYVPDTTVEDVQAIQKEAVETTPVKHLYGVLKINRFLSVLLYVTDHVWIDTVPLQDGVSLFAVKTLAWDTLPSVKYRCKVRTAHNSAKHNALNIKSRIIQNINPSDTEEHSENDQEGNASNKKQNDTFSAAETDLIVRYLELIHFFCESVSQKENSFYSIAGQGHYFQSGNITSPANRRQKASFLFYSTQVDLTLNADCLVRQDGLPTEGKQEREKDRLHELFQWNYNLTRPSVMDLSEYKDGTNLFSYLPSFIRGYVGTVDVAVEKGKVVKLWFITRLCRRYSGTRYNRRGLEMCPPGEHSGNYNAHATPQQTQAQNSESTLTDGADEGSSNRPYSNLHLYHSLSGVVANFAITTIWAFHEGKVAVYDIVRGSVPKLWKQTINLTLKPPLTISFPEGESGNGSVELQKHFELLSQSVFPSAYRVVVVNTLSASKFESPLSHQYQVGFERFTEGHTTHRPPLEKPYTFVNYNVSKKMKALHYADMTEDFLQQVQTATGDGVDWEGLFNFTRYHVSAKNGTEMVKQGQQTVFRVNCLDCLDRTNLLQSQIGHIMLDHMIAYVTDAGEATIRQRKDPHQDSAHRALNFLFAQQGHALSYLYTNVTFHFQYYLLYGKKNNPWDMLWAAFISGMRFIHQNFFDGRKQDAVSVVTGQHAPIYFFNDYSESESSVAELHNSNPNLPGGNDIVENPFLTHNFEQVNKQIFYAVFVGVLLLMNSGLYCAYYILYHFVYQPLVHGGPPLASNGLPNRHLMFKVNLFFIFVWILYFFTVYSKLKKYRHTFTNGALLEMNNNHNFS